MASPRGLSGPPTLTRNGMGPAQIVGSRGEGTRVDRIDVSPGFCGRLVSAPDGRLARRDFPRFTELAWEAGDAGPTLRQPADFAERPSVLIGFMLLTWLSTLDEGPNAR